MRRSGILICEEGFLGNPISWLKTSTCATTLFLKKAPSVLILTCSAASEQNAPDHLQSKYEKQWLSLPRYEQIITWPLVAGPGFCGATHPGADTVFVDIMVGINSYVYNSDCLYVNPARRIFAISDPPGITTGSRRLFERLDGYLKTAADDLEAYFNRLNRETRPEEGATLSLVHFPLRRTRNSTGHHRRRHIPPVRECLQRRTQGVIRLPGLHRHAVRHFRIAGNPIRTWRFLSHR